MNKLIFGFAATITLLVLGAGAFQNAQPAIQDAMNESASHAATSVIKTATNGASHTGNGFIDNILGK